MVQSYDFLVHAYRNELFRQEINEHILLDADSELTHYSALLKFDSVHKMIREYPLEGAMFACKIIPMELSYEAFNNIMESSEPWLIAEKECHFLD